MGWFLRMSSSGKLEPRRIMQGRHEKLRGFETESSWSTYTDCEALRHESESESGAVTRVGVTFRQSSSTHC